MKPEISIIVPVYNVEKYIEKCIDSIINQSFDNIEVILVNDGSTDKSGIICNEYANKDSRLKVIHKKNGGLSSARNTALEIAKGKYIGFVDSDDWIDKYMYEKLYNLCIETNSDIGICNFRREVKGKLDKIEYKDDIVNTFDNLEGMKELFKGVLYRFSACNKLFKRECIKEIRFPEGRIHEDLSTTYKIFAHADKVVYSDYPGYIYLKREESILNSKYNENRLQAFIGWNEIINYINKEYVSIEQQVIACFGYSCVDNMYYILNQVKEKKKRDQLLNILREHIIKNYRSIKKNDVLSIKYKMILGLLRYNTGMIVTLYNIKKGRVYE